MELPHHGHGCVERLPLTDCLRGGGACKYANQARGYMEALPCVTTSHVLLDAANGRRKSPWGQVPLPSNWALLLTSGEPVRVSRTTESGHNSWVGPRQATAISRHQLSDLSEYW